ncbi:MAG: DNA polymerase I [Oscillatoria sp. PMC 1068.18]|nr:DNA polymerase I [Oscillatoria sp. PMC 1076.18]MEC4988230.1 DNA polymerase I [Oscillatoria sp. PMC 1068.18]
MVKTTSTSNPSPAGETQPLLILVDGHSLAFRNYYAFANSRDRGLRTTSGVPTSVCFGFLRSLLQVMEAQQPESMAIAFDLGLPTFRHEADDTYKADRPGTPEDFIPDLKNLQLLLAALQVPVVTSPGYEADDILATLAKQASAAQYRVKIVTGDRDLFQLVNNQNQISVLYLDRNSFGYSSRGNLREFGEAEVTEKLGIPANLVVDYKALCGDKSDNIPGVKGIGDKTAIQLLTEYGNLAAIYQNLDKIKGATQKKLAAGKEAAEHSQNLAQLKFDAPTEITLADCRLQGFDTAVLKPLLTELELKTFLEQIDKLQQQFGGTTEAQILDETEETIEDDDLFFWSAEATEKAELPAEITIQAQIIDTPEKLNKLIAQLATLQDKKFPVAWDTETSDLEPRDAKLVGIGCCWGEKSNQVAYIPINHHEGNNLEQNQVFTALRPILESDIYPKVLHNAKFDRLVFLNQGIKLAGVVFETMLASYLLQPDNSHNLSDVAERYSLGVKPKRYADLEIPKGKNIADLEIKTVADYCGLDAYATWSLVSKLRAELNQIPELHQLLLEIEQPLEPVLAMMEHTGIKINQAKLEKFSQKLSADLETLEARVYQAAGEEFNLGSPKQLSVILFDEDKLNLDRRKSRKTKTGYSTNHAVLEKLQGSHPIIDDILEYRTLSKLKSTYVDALPALVREDTGRVHTNFNQTVTATGRLSSSNPNLQNIPIRTEFSRQIRQAFIPESNWSLISADYSQIELRILAHLSKEPVLVDAYQNSRDIHTVTAQLLFEKENVTSDERRLGKTINFGVIYGMGSFRFARETGIDPKLGKEFIEKYRYRYPRIFEYLEGVKKDAIARGYVTTIQGRRRYFNFTSRNLQHLRGHKPEEIDLEKLKNIGQFDSQLLRAAANATIQGSSADIIKIAMINLHQILQNYQARLLLQVHDELVLEVPPEESSELQPKIRATMENAVALTVPLVVEVRAGDNWMEAK